MKEQLESLLLEVKAAFDGSDIKKTAEAQGRHWHYSIIDATSLREGEPLIVGFNWGAANKGEFRHEPQTSVTTRSFANSDAGAMKRLRKYLVKHSHDETIIDRVSTSNMCFFRSPNEADITQADLARCDPLWEKLLKVLKPSIILIFTASLRDRLLSDQRLADLRKIPVKYLRRGSDVTYEVIHASYRGIPVLSLPHPNFPMPGIKRDEAWSKAFASLE